MSLPDRPPLADHLFDDRPRFVEAMSRFPKCQPIIPYLQRLPEGATVERVLEELQAEAEQYPERYRQLAAIRFYLHYMLWECEVLWNREVARGVTNYKTLLDQLERWRKPRERICLVTFNYDRMLETALPTVGIEIRELPDYIAGENYEVIKLHGSVNWAREVDTPIEDLLNRNTWQVAYELMDKAAELNISERYRIVTEYPIGKLDQIALFPAVAIPVENKRDYECPPEHLEALFAFVPEVTKILVIGWRGAEVPFRTLLFQKLRHEPRVMVVSGSPDGARGTIKRLQQVSIRGKFYPANGGFTDFIVSREGDEFLRS